MPPIQNTITDNSKLSKPKPRGKLKHALVDVDFYNDPKIKSLVFKYGLLAELYYTRLVCSISRSECAQIDRDAALAIAHDCGFIDTANYVLDYILDKKILEIEGDAITSVRVREDQERLSTKQEEWRARKQKQRECHADVTRDNCVTSSVTSEYQTSEVLKTEDLNSEDLNSNPKQGGSKGGDPPQWAPYAQNLPESLNDPDIRHALGAWLYKQTQLHKPRDQMAVEALAANWANRPKEFLASLRESTANGWKTLIEPKSTAGPPGGSKITYEKETNYERNLRIIREA
jgi:hypothetical protein